MGRSAHFPVRKAYGSQYAATAVAGFLLISPHSGDDSPSAAELARAAGARGIRCHTLGDRDDPAGVARTAADADALGRRGRRRLPRRGRGGCARAEAAVRLRPLRHAQPLRARPRSRPRLSAGGARGVRGTRAAGRRRQRQRAALPRQRTVSRSCSSRRSSSSCARARYASSCRARHSEMTCGCDGNANSSAVGSSSGPNQASAATSSAGRSTPPTGFAS